MRDPRALLACLAALLGVAPGCAVDMPVVDLHPPLEAAALDRDDRRSAVSLGLVPLEDQRPETQHEGERPTLWIFLLYNQRKGPWITGDEHFARPVSESTSEAIADALRGSRFGSARVLDRPPSRRVADALSACTETGLDYVGIGAVDALYGTLEQRAYLAILPIPFVALIGFGNSKSDALGVVALDLEILECATRQSVYRRRILRQLRYPEESPPAAARMALFDVLEQIRNETTPR